MNKIELRSYKVYITQGQGETLATEKLSLEEAIVYTKHMSCCGSFRILCPDGTYYDWGEMVQ